MRSVRPRSGRTDFPYLPRDNAITRSIPRRLLDLAALLLARTLAGKRLFRAATVARLQIEGVLLDILDDIFLLHLALEAAKRAFDRFAFLNFDFSQA